MGYLRAVYFRKRTVLFVCLLFLSAGCAVRTENLPLNRFDGEEGYRLKNLAAEENSDEFFVILTFSGGGTRAASFSYGALEKLRDTKVNIKGKNKGLLAEVDLISSVSGGSFTAAYYGLFGDRIFEDFERKFLKANVQKALLLRALAYPQNWIRLASPYFDRIDLAAEYYDEYLYEGKTFRDLAQKGQKPFLIINSTDLVLGSRFPFTQEQFDLLYSDLSSYPVARAVAASSAFPGIFTPITLNNYSKGEDFKEPSWFADALEDPDLAKRRYVLALNAKSYFDVAERPYIHLVDGGVSDNIGLRGPLWMLSSNDPEGSILRAINLERVKTVVVIVVNARVDKHKDWNRDKESPGLVKVLNGASGASMDNFSFETTERLKEYFTRRKQGVKLNSDVEEIVRECHPGFEIDRTGLHKVDFYAVEVDFDHVKDDEVRNRLKNLPTNYTLSEEDVDTLRDAAGEVISDSTEFKRLLENF